LVVLLSATVISAAAVLMFLLLRELRVYTFDVPAYHYDVGIKFPHGIGAAVERGSAGVKLTDGRSEYPLDSIPVFLEGGRTVLLPDSMAVCVPEEGVYGRISYFSTLTEREGGYILRSGEERGEVSGGFMFDGQNRYIFMERAELVWGEGEDERITLEPLSYVTVIYNLRVEIYPRDSESGILLNTGTARVMAYMGGYSVDLSKDIMYMDGRERLLFTDPNLLEPYIKKRVP
jgi:hypothetical protein